MITTTTSHVAMSFTIIPKTNEGKVRDSILPERFHSTSKPMSGSIVPREFATTTKPKIPPAVPAPPPETK
ncbi:MAG: hypothetical protein QOJ40_2015 [Verrucomicrobiota bacterium]